MKLLVLLLLVYVTAADETPGFFIKLSKSVPRIGRRGDFENFFLKQSKSVPRIGRRGGFLTEPANPSENANNWFERLMRPSKRLVENGQPAENGKIYSKVRPLDLHHIIDILSDDLFFGSDLKFISWDVLDKALEEDPDLMAKLGSLARDKEVHQLKQLLSENKSELIQYVPLEGGAADVHSNKAYIYRTDREDQSNAQLGKEKIEYQQ
ncbi:uncharacterized protein LOC6036413 [Culex quinquefasciatus]|uniref:uncharacterized protein LOC6036413 n=1 Tax=Culex quinquefasciatus TaxID=7176 RepID=UPI0018E3CDC0|nr:uncharacterized protein LOC6036413 [Culex quinquefasciatus]XP_039443390.2 uncharacterized protein LOC120423595 [Culex pipiens pallens]